MRKLNTFLFTVLFFLACTAAYAIPARPGKAAVKLPDGSTIIIENHGDEFLNWRTCNGRLVEKGPDGFYYYASFDADGYIVRSGNRASSSISGFTRTDSHIDLPQAALQRARTNREKAEMASAAAMGLQNRGISIGANKFLTILIEFPDLKMQHTNEEFVNLLNEKGYSVNGATGSAKDYYQENSDNQFQPDFVIVGPYTASKEMAYYGENLNGGVDGRQTELFAEIVRLADNDIDFSQYDADNNGVVDNLFFYYAGYNEAEWGPEETIWPHKYSLYYEYVEADGKQVLDYACTSELTGNTGNTLCGIGTFSHEFGHVLGLPDFYDTDYDKNGYSKALGNYSLMCGGGYNNNGNTPPYFTSFEREMLQWSNGPEEITESGEYTLENVTTNKSYIINTQNKGEYFQFESRGGEGWDAYIPTGMLIYHIDKSANKVGGKTASSRWTTGYGINDIAKHQCCDLVEACGTEKNEDPQADIFPGSYKITEFTEGTQPALRDWEDRSLNYRMTQIQDNKAAGVTFKIAIHDIEAESAFLIDKNLSGIYIPEAPLKPGDLFYLEVIVSKSEKVESIEWTVNDKKANPEKAIVLEKGIYNIEAKIKFETHTEVLTQKLNIE